MAEEVVIVKAPAKQAATVVTSENRAAFMEKKLDIAPPPPKEEPKAEAAAPVADATPQEPTEKDAKPADPKDAKKHELNERFSTLTRQRKEAEAKAEAEATARRAAEAKAAELEAKLNPTKPEANAEAAPQRAQFTTDDDYLQALTDWKVDQRLAERDKAAAIEREKAAQTAKLTAYQDRYAAMQKEVPDFEAKLAASPVRISDQLRDAIVESEVGPKIQLYLADHPEEADRLGRLTVGAMLREVGKIEAKLEAPARTNTVTPEKGNVVEISRAPAPITPIKGNGAAVEDPVSASGEFKGTYQQWKEARKAGKIK